MAETLQNPVLPRKKVGLWTPWGAQKVPSVQQGLDQPRQDWKRDDGDDIGAFTDAAEAARPPA